VSLEFSDAYKRAVEQEMRKTADYVSAGKCASYEDYKSKCTHIAGMKKALELFDSVAKSHGELEE
jgi:proline dehydrogenase